MKIAYEAHKNQVDKGGIPYIFHPYHLAEQMNNEILVCAALLHDVAEDTEITIEQLEEEFPPAVTDILRLLTHEEGVEYEVYVAGICTNKEAAFVKLADLVHNMTEERLPDQSYAEQNRRRMKKYTKALAKVVHFLESQITEGSEEEELLRNILKGYHGTMESL